MNQPGEETTHFLNVDLEVSSRSDLQPIIDSFGEKVCVLYAAKRGRIYYAHFEITARVNSADFAIRRFCALIRALPPKVRALWNGAIKRDFSIGVQVMNQPRTHDLALAAETVKAAAAAGARIVYTTYSPEVARESVQVSVSAENADDICGSH